HPAYAPLHYVLLFPFGEPGWHEQFQLIDPDSGVRKSQRITQTHFAAFCLHPLPMVFPIPIYW
ncbi:hypothetical protein GYMLUDRAFT_175616, partial [Collybiopsis luxurians FD-317 M1]